MNILWVEDEDEYIGGHIDALRESGHDVTVLRTASEAYAELAQETPATEWDLLLLDVVLPPGHDSPLPKERGDMERGLDLLEALAARKDCKLPPVVIISGTALYLDDASIQQRFRGVQVRNVLPKPLRISQLLEVVHP